MDYNTKKNIRMKQNRGSGGRLLNSIYNKRILNTGQARNEKKNVKQKAPHTRITIVRDHNLQFCKCSDL